MSKLWIFILWLLITASTPFLPTPETTSSPQLDNLPLQRVTTERATPQAGLPPTSCTPYLVALGYETAVYQDRFLFAASTDNTVTIWHYGQNFTDDKIVAQVEITDGQTPPNKLPSGMLNSVALSPDGKTLATATKQSKVDLWDAMTGKMLHRLDTFTSWISSAAFTPDSSKLIIVNDMSEPEVWDVQSGKLLNKFAGVSAIRAESLSLDGKLFVVSDNLGHLNVSDITLGKPLYEKYVPAEIHLAEFSPDNRLLMMGDVTGAVSVLDARTGHELNSLPVQKALSANRALFTFDNKVVIINYSTLFFKSEKSTIVVAYDMQTWKSLYTIKDPDAWIDGEALSPDGKTLLTAVGHTKIELWDARSGKLLHSLGNPSLLHAGGKQESPDYYANNWLYLAFSSDSKRFLTGDTFGIDLWWDTQTGQLIGPLCPLLAIDR